ncbi:MAG: lamin tail domain-containing protein, partial [Pyrinomonadaceae bacterium]
MSYSPRHANKFDSTRRKLLTIATTLAVLCGGLFTSRTRPASAQTFAPNIVISQIYTRGGETGAAFRNDYVELFNRGTAPVSLNGYSLQMTTREGNITTATSLALFTGGFINIAPGQYFLVQFGSSGTDGAALPSPDLALPFADFVKLGHDGGQVAIVRNTDQIQPLGCAAGLDPDIADLVGYGLTNCFEGSVAPSPTLADAI